MTHTPGPWHTDPTKSFYVFADGSLSEQAGVTDGPFVANASTLANACLIASAPDLLAALQNLVGMAEYFPSELYTQHPSVVEARAAIARATG